MLARGIWKGSEFVPTASTTDSGVQSQTASQLPRCPQDHPQRYHNCYGTYRWKNGEFIGDKYVGEWRNNLQHGQGTYYYATGDKYVGEFKDRQFNGQGTYSYANGDKYVGGFKDGKRNDQGTYYRASGDKYMGEWKDGKENGQGTYYHLADSEWKGDKYVG